MGARRGLGDGRRFGDGVDTVCGRLGQGGRSLAGPLGCAPRNPMAKGTKVEESPQSP